MRQPETDPTGPTRDDAYQGRPDTGLPGADRDDREPPDAPQAELPERLGERVGNEPDGGIATGEPDMLPNVEVPEETM